MTGCDSCSSGSCSSGDPDRLPPGMLKAYDIDQSVADGTLVFVEVDVSDGVPKASSVGMEILSEARRLSEGKVYAVIFGGPKIKTLYPVLYGCGADVVYHSRDKAATTYLPEAWAEIISGLIARISPAVVLFGATAIGRELAPRVAAHVHAGLTADCTRLSMTGRDLIATRPAFGGALIAEISYCGYPQIATVRPGVLPEPDFSEESGTSIYWQFPADTIKNVIEEHAATECRRRDIADARILISLGSGIRDKELVLVAERVAETMGAEVSCSRALVEKGWMPRSKQVGMSGHTVRPDLYIAFGISGSVQHLAGMSGAKRVIAINRDPKAPIHGFVDISLIADAGEVLRSLERKLG